MNMLSIRTTFIPNYMVENYRNDHGGGNMYFFLETTETQMASVLQATTSECYNRAEGDVDVRVASHMPGVPHPTCIHQLRTNIPEQMVCLDVFPQEYRQWKTEKELKKVYDELERVKCDGKWNISSFLACFRRANIQSTATDTKNTGDLFFPTYDVPDLIRCKDFALWIKK